VNSWSWKAFRVASALSVFFAVAMVASIFANLPITIVDALTWLAAASFVITFYSIVISIVHPIFEMKETTQRKIRSMISELWEALYPTLVKAERCFKRAPGKAISFGLIVYAAIGNCIYFSARGLLPNEFGFPFWLNEIWLLMPILVNCVLFLMLCPWAMNTIEGITKKSPKWQKKGYAQIAIIPITASLAAYIWLLGCFYNLEFFDIGKVSSFSFANALFWIFFATVIPCSSCLEHFVRKGEHWVIEDRGIRRKIIFYGCAQFFLACVLVHLYAIHLYAKTQPIIP